MTLHLLPKFIKIQTYLYITVGYRILNVYGYWVRDVNCNAARKMVTKISLKCV